MPVAHAATSSASTIRITITTIGKRERRLRTNNDSSAGGFTRGSVVACPHR
jgi:hypothetical protein